MVRVVRRPAWDLSQDLPRFLWRADTCDVGILHNVQVRIVVGISGFGARHFLQASPVLWVFSRSLPWRSGRVDVPQLQESVMRYKLCGTFKTFPFTAQACLLSAMIAPEFVGLASEILRVPFLLLFEKVESTFEGIRQFYVGVELEEWKFGHVL